MEQRISWVNREAFRDAVLESKTYLLARVFCRVKIATVARDFEQEFVYTELHEGDDGFDKFWLFDCRDSIYKISIIIKRENIDLRISVIEIN